MLVTSKRVLQVCGIVVTVGALIAALRTVNEFLGLNSQAWLAVAVLALYGLHWYGVERYERKFADMEQALKPTVDFTPEQRAQLLRYLKPFASKSFSIWYGPARAGFFAMELASILTDAGCADVSHRKHWTVHANGYENFLVASHSQVDADGVISAMNRAGLKVMPLRLNEPPGEASIRIVIGELTQL